MFRWLAVTVFVSLHGAAAAPRNADVVIYGATPAGLAAAEAVVREGRSAILINPSSHAGGMLTGGIAITDTRTPELVGGIAREFFEEVAGRQAAAVTWQEAPRILFRGQSVPARQPRRWDFEPKLGREVFEEWVRRGRYTLLKARTLARVEKRGTSITSLRLDDGSTVSGKVFIDASYEGDLMAQAGVSNTYGRESGRQFGEKLAGVQLPHFVRNYPAEFYRTPGGEYLHHGQFGADIPARDESGRLQWGVDPGPSGPAGSGDRLLQAFCYRLVATQRPELRLPWPKPAKYDPERYRLLLRYIQSHPGISFTRLVHLDPIPNGKFDLNASGPFSIDYVGGNRDYPVLGAAARGRMLEDHKNYQQGLFWFLAHDPRVPQVLRDEVNSWGLCRDEWPDTGNWPVQLYIREARRMVGEHVMTESEVLRDKRKDDSIGMGSFVLDSHWVRRYADERGFVRVEGHLDESINLAQDPYEIPYRSILPKRAECRNLLVPVCLSASHVAMCTIRMEPVYLILGHSAGAAAVIAVQGDKGVQEIDLTELRHKLERAGQVIHAPAMPKLR